VRIVLLPLRLIKEIYWLFDRDAKIRSLGLMTVGTIVSVNEQIKTSQVESLLSDDTVETVAWNITYSFETDGGHPAATKEVNRQPSLNSGHKVKVYYRTNTFPNPSALDRDMRVLSASEVMVMEDAHRGVLERGTRATGRVRAIRKVRPPSPEGYDWEPITFGLHYEFKDERGRRWTNTKWMSEHPTDEVGSEITVRYLPERPEMSRVE
jgi:hypothetical protein